MKTKAMIVDGHASVREMLGSLLIKDGTYDVVAEVATGFDAMRVFQRARPSLVVLELLLPEMDGLETIRQLHVASRDIRILVYSGSTNAELILEALRERPHGFVHKKDSLATVLEALRAVARGCSYFTPFATELLDEARGRDSARPALTGRERVVLQMVAEGMSNKQMAQRMCVSPKTVEYHRGRLMKRLGLHDIAAMTRYATRLGLVMAEA